MNDSGKGKAGMEGLIWIREDAYIKTYQRLLRTALSPVFVAVLVQAYDER